MGSPSIVSLTPSGNSVLVKGLAQGNDVISYTISNSCKTDVATYPVVVITPSEVFIPNLFSPNNDGHNDKFYVRGSAALYSDVHLYIFSSWGNLLFESNGPIDNDSNGWDGKYKGQPQPTGVYIYVAKLTQPNGTSVTKKGSITLIR